MAKIYTEIIIDMNPESSTFEETLYEDSFEYSGELDLAGSVISGDEEFYDSGETWYDRKGNKYYLRWATSGAGGVKGIKIYKNDNLIWHDAYSGRETRDYALQGFENIVRDEATKGTGDDTFYRTKEEYIKNHPEGTREERIEEGRWGAKGLTDEDFFDPITGERRDPDEIAQTLFDAGAEGNLQEIKEKVLDYYPELEEVEEEELGFLKTDRLATETAAGQTKEIGISKLSSQLPETIGKPSIGGSGLGMRKQISTLGSYREGLGDVYDVYGESMKGAEDVETKGIYDLEEEKKGKYMEDIEKTFFYAMGGGLVPSYAKGGRVSKNKKAETFLDFLTQLPDAGGS